MYRCQSVLIFLLDVSFALNFSKSIVSKNPFLTSIIFNFGSKQENGLKSILAWTTRHEKILPGKNKVLKCSSGEPQCIWTNDRWWNLSIWYLSDIFFRTFNISGLKHLRMVIQVWDKYFQLDNGFRPTWCDYIWICKKSQISKWETGKSCGKKQIYHS